MKFGDEGTAISQVYVKQIDALAEWKHAPA